MSDHDSSQSMSSPGSIASGDGSTLPSAPASTSSSTAPTDNTLSNLPAPSGSLEDVLSRQALRYDTTEDSDVDEAVATVIYHGDLPAPSITPITSFIKNPPHSKTAIGRLTYQLEDLPTLFVAETKTLCSPATSVQGSSGAWDIVQHRRLRSEATREFLSRPSIASLSPNIAVNQGVNRTSDHLITLANAGDTVLAQELRPHRVNLALTKKRSKKNDTQDQSDADRSIACEIRGPDGELNKEKKAELYWKSFRALILKRAGQYECPDSDCTKSEFVVDLPPEGKLSRRVNPFEGTERPGPTAIDSGLPLGVRICPSINKEHGRLHLDFDIVPYVPKGFLHEVLFAIFGKESLLDNPFGHIHMLRELFKGLQVRCAYTAPDKAGLETGENAVLLGENTFHKGRQFRIADIKMLENIPDFDVGDEKHSVKSFFDNSKYP